MEEQGGGLGSVVVLQFCSCESGGGRAFWFLFPVGFDRPEEQGRGFVVVFLS